MKMASQRFCLRWNNHQSNLLSVFDQLLHAETFTDVTLAVDGQYLKAHKMVLSACSPYFNSLFLNHPEKHPIVILKDVPFADMKSLLDFMYRGEVSVDQERLTAFLRVAESLRIKGLTEVNDDKPSNSEPTPPQPPQLQRIQPYVVQQQQQQQQQRQKSQQSNINNNNNNNNNNNCPQTPTSQQQKQQSLLSSALASMPKRKRGRPRKLSGSDDGDYDDFEGEMGDGKMCNDSYSGNDDGSDDNQRDSGNNDDLNESRDSLSPSKKTKQLKDNRNQQQQQDDNSTSDGNDSDNDDPMDTSYMEPQLMLDEYDEPVEFKFDPNADSPAQDNVNMSQQARQQAFLLAATQKQQQLVEAAAAAAAAGGMKMSAIVGTGPLPGTVTLMNNMVSIPKLAPIVKQNKPKINKRVKLKHNGVGPDIKPTFNTGDYMDLIAGNFMNSPNAVAQAAKLKSALSASTVQLITSTPELSQRLFGINKPQLNNSTAATTTPTISTNTTTTTTFANSNNPKITLQTQNAITATPSIEFSEALTAHLPTVLGLKMKSNLQINTQSQSTTGQQVQSNTNPNSLLKQQLGAGLKELIDVTITNATAASSNAKHMEIQAQEACSALQSLATVAERQAVRNHHLFYLQFSPKKSSGEFFHQQNALLMREEDNNMDLLINQGDKSDPEMLTLADENAGLDYSTGNETGGNQNGTNDNPESSTNSANNSGASNTTARSKNSSNKQAVTNVAERQAAQNNNTNIQPPSANNLHHQFILHLAANPIKKSSGKFFHQQNAKMLMREEDNNLDLLMDQGDKSDPEMLTLADENAGLDYSTGNETGGNQIGTNDNLESSTNSASANNTGSSNVQARSKNSSSKPVQRRRIRRKAQSSLDDQAEQLTEMSVRGLDLFRYASINEGVYQCTECAKENMQKTFKNKYSFQRHAFLYHEGKHRKVFPCPLCGKEFSRPDKMKNHMKMTHESFVSKEIQNYNPLNYLITAAAAGEIQATFPAPNTNNINQTPTNPTQQPSLLNQLQSNNPALSILINTNDQNEEAGLNLTQQQHHIQQHQQQQHQQQELLKENLQKQLKFPTDIEIKNEIVISPSPSPPPISNATTTVSFAETFSLLQTSTKTTQAQKSAQRLEEVK